MPGLFGLQGPASTADTTAALSDALSNTDSYTQGLRQQAQHAWASTQLAPQGALGNPTKHTKNTAASVRLAARDELTLAAEQVGVDHDVARVRRARLGEVVAMASGVLRLAEAGLARAEGAEASTTGEGAAAGAGTVVSTAQHMQRSTAPTSTLNHVDRAPADAREAVAEAADALGYAQACWAAACALVSGQTAGLFQASAGPSTVLAALGFGPADTQQAIENLKTIFSKMHGAYVSHRRTEEARALLAEARAVLGAGSSGAAAAAAGGPAGAAASAARADAPAAAAAGAAGPAAQAAGPADRAGRAKGWVTVIQSRLNYLLKQPLFLDCELDCALKSLKEQLRVEVSAVKLMTHTHMHTYMYAPTHIH